MRILFVGDIFGRPGRNIVHERLPELQKQHGVELTIANGENAAGGFGITPQIAEELFELGIDVITTGNHIWDKREIIEYMNSANGNEASLARRLLRPANYPAGSPGFGWYQGRTRSGVRLCRHQSAGTRLHDQQRRPFSRRRRAAEADHR